jgi:hypothetical protein
VDPEALDEPEPRHLAPFVPKARQKLGQPRGVVPQMQPSDQRRPVGIRPLEHVEQLAGSAGPRAETTRWPMSSFTLQRVGGIVSASTTMLSLCSYRKTRTLPGS